MDKKDHDILRLIQSDAGLSMNDVAERTALSRTAVWRRVRELEQSGVIKARVSILDPEALGFNLMVFAFVRTNQHSDTWFSKFERAVDSIPEILEFHRTSGDIDYLLRVVARDMRHYDEIYKRLIRKVDFADISSTFVMETFKSGTTLPI
ncbi:MAG: Lrp/AsnC family transcriptional regulator [Gammaproteobacteria bacterium]|nr:Lrp/AsnC family transcriptional regulator [Gammaproteobacteria bacterium]NNL51579.1 Lrp/AsnC family transcriptional regulator [Woeseiaceae bacterium]